MNNGRHASPIANGHLPSLSATSPSAPMKSVKLVLRQKNTSSKPHQDGPPGTPLDVLERELPPRNAFLDQIPLADVVDRLVQDAYSKLVELSDTLPGTAPNARGRDLEAYALETRKKFMKAYVLSKWAKSAHDVETSMALYAYLDEHGNQIDHAVHQLTEIKSLVGGARLRNADLATALTVLTEPPLMQKSLLPTMIRDIYAVTKPLSATEVKATLSSLNEVIRVRLRLWEIVPLEWSGYTIDNGRVYFTCKDLFAASFSLTGSEGTDTWYIIDMEFLTGIGGASQERTLGVFPRKVPPHLWAQIVPGVNHELAVNMAPLQAEALVKEAEEPIAPPLIDPTEKASADVVDAPLVRAFNLLQMLSFSYQLEILIHQVQTLRSLGWADHLGVNVRGDRQSIAIRYWMRSSTQHPVRLPNGQHAPQLPPQGGTITISIEKHSDDPKNPKPSKYRRKETQNSHVKRLARELDQKLTLEAIKRARRTGSLDQGATIEQSDQVESAFLLVHWEPSTNAWGLTLPEHLVESESQDIRIDPCALDCEAVIKNVTRRHARLILRFWLDQIQIYWRRFLASPDGAVLMDEDNTPCLRLVLFQDLTLYVLIDLRTGKLVLRDAGDLAAWERGSRFSQYARTLNETPLRVLDVIQALRFNSIVEAVELQVNYIGLQSTRNLLLPSEMQKFGDAAPGYIFINLPAFPPYYLVVVVTSDGFKYALINTSRELGSNRVLIEDLGWLDPQNLGLGPASTDFAIRTDVLRELYAFACARVSHTKVEVELKALKIPYTLIFPSSHWNSQGPRNRRVPVLSIKATDLWPNASGSVAEGACQNVKVSVMNWWNEAPPQIVTEVKLKSPPPISLGTSPRSNQVVSGPGLQPNSLVSYDPKTSIVSFLSSNVELAFVELQGEWDRVQKTLAIARHVSNTSRLKGYEDVRLLSFNLLTIEFTYQSDFVATIEYVASGLLLQPHFAPTGTFKTSFTRLSQTNSNPRPGAIDDEESFNPHQEIARFLSPRLIEGNAEQTRQAVYEFVLLLRSTLPVLQELEGIRRDTALARRKSPSRPKTSIIYKGAAWFRILYNTTYALDIRMLANRQVAIIDAACSLFQPSRTAPPPEPSLILSLPRLEELVDTVISNLSSTPSSTPSPTSLYSIGKGLRCSESLAKTALRGLHESVLEVLLELS